MFERSLSGGRRRWAATSRAAAALPALVVLVVLAPAVALFSQPAVAAGQGTAEPVAALQKAHAAPLVLAMGDLRGEIRPCGCSAEGQFGGLPRRLSYLAGSLSGGGPEQPLLVDLGNNFPPPSPQGDLKIALIQELLKRFPPLAILPGPNELALGPGRLDPELPYLVSNDGVGKAFRPHRAVRRGGVLVAIFGYLSPAAVYQKSQRHFRLQPVGDSLLRRWRALIAERGFERSVLLFRGDDRELAVLHRSGLFQAIIAGNPFDDEMNQVVERNVDGTRIPQVPTKGQGVVRLRLAPRLPLGAGQPALEKVDWLSGEYADHPDAAGAFKTYEDGVKKLFFAGMQAMEKRRATSQFVGAATCRTCHAAPGKIWEASRHGGALKTLERVGKQFDPECIACHVAGFKRGGFVSAQLTPNMAGVQCENCHGPGKAHLANPAAKPAAFSPPGSNGAGAKPGQATCRTCHLGSHSPSFDFEKYWPKVKH
ncbi:MAG: multiheme c-type cytochrome [bacterium]